MGRGYVMDGRRLLEVVVAVVGMAAFVGALIWLYWVVSNFGQAR